MTSRSANGPLKPEGPELAAQGESAAAQFGADQHNVPTGSGKQTNAVLSARAPGKVPSSDMPHKSMPVGQPASQTAAEFVSRTATLGSRWNWLNWTCAQPSASCYADFIDVDALPVVGALLNYASKTGSDAPPKT